MAFKLEKFFADVFAPQNGEVVTIMYDLPHGEIQDNVQWRERQEMAGTISPGPHIIDPIKASNQFPPYDQRVSNKRSSNKSIAPGFRTAQ